MKFTATIDNGQGGETNIEATDAAEALRIAKAWAMKGEWKQDGEVSVEVWCGQPRPHAIPDAEAMVTVSASSLLED